MKRLLCLLAVSLNTFAGGYNHQQTTTASNWGEMQKTVFSVEQAVPLQLTHNGDAALYEIVVDGTVISEPFRMVGVETVSMDVPVTLADKEGSQKIKVCSKSKVEEGGHAGALVCNVIEFVLLGE